MIKIIIAANIATLAATLLSGCASQDDTGPLMHYELEGTWCTAADPVETCLTVIHPSNAPPTQSYYVIQSGLCFETGRLSGGLEFDPDTKSRLCLPNITRHMLYSAAGEWTATGIRLEVNQSDGTVEGTSETLTLEMAYQP